MGNTPENTEPSEPEHNPLKPINANDGLKDPALQEMLQDYQKAIREEFDAEHNPELVDRNAVVELAGKKLDKMIGMALVQIEDLMENASSESVRANLAKYVIDRRLGEAIKGDGDNPITKLFEQLRGNDAKIDAPQG